MKTVNPCLSVAAILFGSCSGVALAQTQTAPPADQAVASGSEDTSAGGSELERALDDIVVTGRKKDVAERAQDVPIAVSAFSGAAMAAARVKDLTDITNMSPGVHLAPSGTVPGYGSYYIRGAGVAGSIPSNDPAVGTFINGMPLGVSTASLTELFDLASIEVLRGPQGTLFGRNVTGGAVLINTARPTEAMHANLRVAGGTQGQWEVGGSVEGGTDNGIIAAKLSFITKHNDGFFHDLGTGKRVGRRNVQIVRPTIVLNPSDALTISTMVEVGNDEGDGPSPLNQFAAGSVVSNSGYVPPKGKFDIRQTFPGFNNLEWTTAVTNADLEVGRGKISAILGYRKADQRQLLDSDGSPLSVNDFGNSIAQHQYFEELRFAGKPFATDAIDLTIGVSGLQQKFNYGENRLTLGTPRALRGLVDHKQYGVFAQTDIALPANFSITLGGRYTYEKKAAQIASLGGCSYPASDNCTFDFVDDDSWSNFGPKAGVQWKPSNAFLAYASFTRGFRSGGFNVRNTRPSIPGPYDEETVDAYEVGFKSEFFDRKLRTNLSAYINKLKGLQQVVADADNRQRILNAADATVKGIEAEVTAIPVRGLVLTGAVGYLDDQFDSFTGLDLTGDGIPDPALAKNLKFVQVPKWNVSASANYETQLGSLGVLTLRGAYTYVSQQPGDVKNTFFLPAYNLFDASIALAINEHVTFSVYGKNLTNELYGGFGALSVLNKQLYASPPRTVMAEIAFKL